MVKHRVRRAKCITTLCATVYLTSPPENYQFSVEARYALRESFGGIPAKRRIRYHTALPDASKKDSKKDGKPYSFDPHCRSNRIRCVYFRKPPCQKYEARGKGDMVHFGTTMENQRMVRILRADADDAVAVAVAASRIEGCLRRQGHRSACPSVHALFSLYFGAGLTVKGGSAPVFS